MPALPEAFDPSTAAPSAGGDYQPFPAGDYLAHIVDSRYEANADNTYAAIKLKCVILSGPKEGKHFFADITRRTKSAQAQGIGDHQLTSLLIATGNVKPDGSPKILQNTDDLHHKPILWTLIIEGERPNPAGGVYAARNKVAAFNGIKAPGAAKPVPPAAKAPTLPPKPPANPPKAQAEAPAETPAPNPSNDGAADSVPDWAK